MSASFTANSVKLTGLVNKDFAENYGLGVLGTLVFDLGVTNTSTLGLDDVLLKNSISVYPSPFNNELHIKTDQAKIEQVVLYNLLGQSLNNLELNNGIIDTSNITRGMYLLKIQTTKGAIIKEIVKKINDCEN